MRSKIVTPAALAAAFLIYISPAAGAETNCLSCHEELATGTSVHAAVAMGCTSCHANADAADVPHQFKGRNPKGLATRLRDLCFTCHDRSTFTKTSVHGAIVLGCTSCHNPHASKFERLLKESVPTLCIGCHQDRSAHDAQKHALAGSEVCSTCHNPHASDAPKLISAPQPSGGLTETAHIKK